MFLLSKEEKISFLKVIYSANMFDNHIQDEENDILEALKTDVFGLDDFQKIDLGKEGIVKEINKIKKTIPTIYLFNILYELGKYYKRDGNNQNKNKMEEFDKEYKEKIDSILDQVDRKDDIIKSQIFQHHPESIANNEKGNKEEDNNDFIEGIADSANDTVSKAKNVFKKLFK